MSKHVELKKHFQNHCGKYIVDISELFIQCNKDGCCYKTKFFLWNTNNTDRNSVNKQNTHTHTKHSEKDNIGKG